MSDKKGKGSGSKDACYHKVKARYSVWPSAYASGALVKCRKKGAANWGNSTKKESFEIDPKKHNKEQKKQKMRNLAIGNENPNEKKVAEKKAGGPKLMGEELNIDLAVDYFYTEGINEDGLDMIIEETGLEKFVEFVEYLTDIEVLTEARAAKRARKGAKSYEQVKAEIDAKEKSKKAKREISVDKTKKATATAKAKQPVEKKPVRDAIARGVFRAVDAYKKGMDRHNAAMATAKKAGKVAGKAAGEFAKGAGEGVKTAGKVAKVAYKVATKEEVEVEEGYKEIDKTKESRMYRRAGNLARTSLSSKGKKKIETAKKSAKIVSAISRQKENERFAKMADEKARSNYNEEVVQSILEKCWVGYTQKGMKKKGNRMVPNCVPVSKEEVEVDEKYQGMYQSPAPTYNRLKSSDEKARMSPGRRAMAKSDELQSSEPGSKRAKAQKKASAQMARNFKSARATKEEFELDERTRYAKETGKDPQTGKESVKGGDKPPAAYAQIEKDLRKTGGLMSSRRKPIQPQGKRKVKGSKPKVKMGPTPVDKIKAKLAKQRAPKKDPYGYGQGRYQGD